MSSIGARQQLRAARAKTEIAKSVLKRFRIDNAPGIKYVEAREYFDRAARAYAAAGKPDLCADAYNKCADMSSRLSRGATLDTVTYHVRCGELLEENDPADAREHYSEACDACCDLGAWATAAELRRRVAGLFEYTNDVAGAEDRVLMLRSAADLYGAAARRLDDESKLIRRRACLVEAAQVEALALQRYAKAADVFEAVATEVMQDNLTAANATRLFFRSALCSLVGGEHDLVRGKVEIFAERFLEFGASPERLFLLDLNGYVTAKPLADYDAFVDACYNFCTVRSLDSWDLKMLKVMNDYLRDLHEAHQQELERQRLKEIRRARKAEEEKNRQIRIKRDEERRERDKDSMAFL
mmetsp:Transcript_25403/g.76299  ORF Transcript_25403/g.76299 Transcript_25403/m.76299 type:complete len:355 (-) Transcript_25403:52-1116(-)